MPELKSADISDDSLELKTHKTESYGIRVDLDGRFFYIDDNEFLTDDWHELEDFAVWLEADIAIIKRVATSLGIKRRSDRKCPPLSFEVIEQEYAWQKYYESLPARISRYEIGQTLGLHYDTITHYAKEWSYKTTRTKCERASKRGSFRYFYPKRFLAALRERQLSVPLDEGWLTLRGLINGTDMDREWAKHRLDESGLSPEMRRSVKDNTIRLHYPPESKQYLQRCVRNVPPAGGDYLTECYIAGMIPERSGKWVGRRLAKFAMEMEIRLDDQRVPRWHYPYWVYKMLKTEAIETVAKTDAEDWYSTENVAKFFDIKPHSTERTMARLGVEREKRFTESGRAIYHYNPQQIIAIYQRLNFELETMFSLDDLAQELGICTRTVSERLRKLNIEPSNRIRAVHNRKLYDTAARTALATTIKEPK